jgi:RNA polymerase sigma-70 factor, ECF subfamily
MTEPDATVLLQASAGGEARAAEQLFERVHTELRVMAEGLMRQQRPGHTLQPTALINEAYVRLIAPSVRGEIAHEQHFIRLAAHAMRSVLVDHARKKRAEKRGGARGRVELDGLEQGLGDEAPDAERVHRALEKLEAVDPELAQLVELRFFGGLPVEQVARVLGVSEATATRQWRAARLFLTRELERES